MTQHLNPAVLQTGIPLRKNNLVAGNRFMSTSIAELLAEQLASMPKSTWIDGADNDNAAPTYRASATAACDSAVGPPAARNALALAVAPSGPAEASAALASLVRAAKTTVALLFQRWLLWATYQPASRLSLR